MRHTCLIAIEIRTELTEPSIRTFSFSLRLMMTGVNRSSLLLLQLQKKRGEMITEKMTVPHKHQTTQTYPKAQLI